MVDKYRPRVLCHCGSEIKLQKAWHEDGTIIQYAWEGQCQDPKCMEKYKIKLVTK